jgi:hypothetical protein
LNKDSGKNTDNYRYYLAANVAVLFLQFLFCEISKNIYVSRQPLKA